MAACVLAIALALAGCGGGGRSAGATSGSSSPAGGSAAAGSAAVITIKDFGFTTPASVAPGAKVSVDNQDDVAHTVTADGGKGFDDAASPGKSSFTAPTTPGSYPFHCSIHPEMHGVLLVQ